MLSISNNNPLIFVTEPDSLVFLLLTVFFVVFLHRVNKPVTV